MRALTRVGPVRISRTDDDRLREVSCSLVVPLSGPRAAYLRRVLGPLVGAPELGWLKVKVIAPAHEAAAVARIMASVCGGPQVAVSTPVVPKPERARPASGIDFDKVRANRLSMEQWCQRALIAFRTHGAMTPAELAGVLQAPEWFAADLITQLQAEGRVVASVHA